MVGEGAGRAGRLVVVAAAYGGRLPPSRASMKQGICRQAFAVAQALALSLAVAPTLAHVSHAALVGVLEGRGQGSQLCSSSGSIEVVSGIESEAQQVSAGVGTGIRRPAVPSSRPAAWVGSKADWILTA